MVGTQLDQKFTVASFDFGFVAIGAVGNNISVAMKDDDGEVFYNWLIAFPFTSAIGEDPIERGEWTLTPEVRLKDRLRVCFTRGDERYVLTLEITNMHKSPMPVRFEWK